jgi:fluoride exporter
MKWLCLAVGGVAGTIARYWLGGLIYQLCGTGFPLGTLAVNLVGCFLIGIFATMAQQKFLLGPELRVLLMIGFCGAFTTFSTLILETDNLVRDSQHWKAFFNVAGSVVFGFIAFRLGILLAEVF